MGYQKFTLLPARLQLFAGDGGGSGDGGGVAGSLGASASGQADDSGGEQPTVLYGRQDGGSAEGLDAGDANNPPNAEKDGKETLKERQARYRELINGEFKDFYQQDTQRMIDRRFKETRGLQEQLENQRVVLDQLSSRYNTPPGDIAALQRALDSDTAMWETAAEEAGMTVDQYRMVDKMRRSNAQMQGQLLRMQAAQRSRQQVETWQREAAELQQDYPDFNLAEFVRDPQNMEYLKHHVPMRMIYEYANRDAIMQDTASRAARQAETNVVNNIRSKGRRPKENGAAQQPGVVVKDNVDSLTNDDIDEIIRRVQRGEHISF